VLGRAATKQSDSRLEVIEMDDRRQGGAVSAPRAADTTGALLMEKHVPVSTSKSQLIVHCDSGATAITTGHQNNALRSTSVGRRDVIMFEAC